MKRFKVKACAKGYEYKFEIELDDNSRQYYRTDNTSIEFSAVDGRIITIPRHEACIEMIPLISETTWKEKTDKE